MAKDAKIEPLPRTLVDVPPEDLAASPHTGAAAVSWLNSLRSALQRLGRTTQFIIVATLILGLTMFFVGNMVSRRMEQAALQSAAEAAAFHMATYLEPYVQELGEQEELSAKNTVALDQLLGNPLLKRHIESVKIWRTDGTVVYSTNKSIVSQRFPSDEIELALSGRVVAGLEDLGQEENSLERTLEVPIYEIYAPLRDTQSGKIIAVGEFYERADRLEKAITATHRQVWTVVGTATLAMLTLLFGFVRRGELIIQRQQAALRARVVEQARLHRRNGLLQKRIANANQQFWKINELTLRRIGADLHDGPAQLLTLILIRLDDLADQLESGTATAEDKEVYETIRGAAQDALREVRDISRGLSLPEIGLLPLQEELTLAARRHEQRTGSKVALDLGELPTSVPLPLKICIYRVVQESLNNAFKHADGQGQTLHAVYAGGVLTLEVSDSGPGFTIESSEFESDGRAHLGLAGLRYRVESFGGRFDIHSEAGKGTRVRAAFRL